MANTNGVFDALARKGSVSTVRPARYTALRSIAENLSRKNVDQAICELLNEAHSRLIQLCYERDDSGHLCNVDEATGKILVPLPFGKNGYKRWNLKPSEADALRRIMFTRQRNGLPLFFFDRSRRSWYLALADHPAMPVLKEWELTVAELRLARGS
jgi:hypothetical protein